MGFFCYSCEKKVRGQPNNHKCTRKKYGNKANDRIYDKSGNKQHRIDRRQVSIWDASTGQEVSQLHYAFGNECGIRNARCKSEIENEYDFNDRDLTRLEEWRAIVQQWDIETSIPCRYNSR